MSYFETGQFRRGICLGIALIIISLGFIRALLPKGAVPTYGFIIIAIALIIFSLIFSFLTTDVKESD